MKLTIRGGSLTQKRLVRLIVPGILTILCGHEIANKLKLNFFFIPDLKKIKDYSGCVGLYETATKPYTHFYIEMDPNRKYKRFLTILCHEMYHIKQHAKGQLEDIEPIKKVFWRGKIINESDYSYYKQPWEREAYDNQYRILRRWRKKQSPEVLNKFLRLKQEYD